MDDSNSRNSNPNAVELRSPYKQVRAAAESVNPRHCGITIHDGLGSHIQTVYLDPMESTRFDLYRELYRARPVTEETPVGRKLSSAPEVTLQLRDLASVGDRRGMLKSRRGL